jgi:hypothetical protein
MLTPRRRSIMVSLSLLAISAACGTVDVPYFSDEGGSGGAAGSTPSGGSGGSGGNGPPSGGNEGTTGGSGGLGGLGGGFSGFGAAGGMGGYVGDLLASSTSNIVDVAATDTHVYWIEYGTFDDLENYQFDGALLRIELASGNVDTLLEDLEGPLQLEITTAEAFLLLERSTTVSPDGDRALGRVPLVGGTLELVEHEGPYDAPFDMASFEDQAYFAVRESGAWSIREYVPGDSGRVILPHDPLMPAADMAADEAHLYFVSGGYWRQALSADVAPEKLSSSQYWPFTLQDTRVLATRGQAPMYLAAMSKDGSAWSNVLRLGDHDSCTELVIRGEAFFAECMTVGSPPYVVTGPWGGGDQRGYKLGPDGSWAATEADLFIAHPSELVRIPLN